MPLEVMNNNKNNNCNYNSYKFSSIYYVSGTLYLLPHLILESSWWNRYYNPHLTDFETQEKKGGVIQD